MFTNFSLPPKPFYRKNYNFRKQLSKITLLSHYKIKNQQYFYDVDVKYKDSKLADNTFIIYTIQSVIVTINFVLSWFPEKLPAGKCYESLTFYRSNKGIIEHNYY